MSRLMERTEYAYIGTLLANPVQETRAWLRGEDFSHPGLGAVFDAVPFVLERHPSILANDPDRISEHLCLELSRHTDLPGLGFQDLRAMAERQPLDDAHMSEAARMIADAAFVRQASTAAREVVQRMIVLESPHPDWDPIRQMIDRHVERVDHGMPLFDGEVNAVPRSGRTGLEEQLVASLKAYPEQARTLQMITPPESVRDPACRAAYEDLIESAYLKTPMLEDDLVGAVYAKMTQSATEGTNATVMQEANAFVYRVERLPVDEYTGVKAARELLAGEVRERIENGHLPFDPVAPALVLHADPRGPGFYESHTPAAGPRVA